jgi:molecular chaperone DnaK (HSP70)
MVYVDSKSAPEELKTFSIPQWVAPGVMESRPTLPSFHYQPPQEEFSPSTLQLPFYEEAVDFSVGVWARDQGMLSPGRMIASAKSWLCHGGVDRTKELLPWEANEGVHRLSPVEAAGRYLRHLRLAWQASFPDQPLEAQEIVLTIPASFDEVARELTVRAARKAGLERVVLVEEPQAAFYAWIHRHREHWEELVSPGQKILVCDIGGGTTDFTLIRVRRTEEGQIRFHRVAVGDHLILGGDNLDLALAHALEPRFVEKGRLDRRSWSTLVGRCRELKELMLSETPPEKSVVSLPGGGSRLIGGSRRAEISREEVESILVDGFFPRVSLDAEPRRRQSGFQEFGLPYASDAAMTRYLAQFLRNHRFVGMTSEEIASRKGTDPARPDLVLLNGGVFEAKQLRDRLLEVISGWFSETGDWSPEQLRNPRLDLSVARGAAYYGMVRRGAGERINAGLARTYYVGVALEATDTKSESPETTPTSHALCLLPAGMEAGKDVRLQEHPFVALIDTPVVFPIYFSSTRLTDQPGDLVEVEPESLTSLPPIQTVLQSRRKEQDRLKVHLLGRLTEIGTIELWCREVDGKGRWRLQFDIRSSTQTDQKAHTAEAEQEGFVEEQLWEAVRGEIFDTFGPNGDRKPAGLMKRLARATESNKRDWPASMLRRMGELLLEYEKGRRKSRDHESRWLNLLGYAYRPGYGMAMDDYRVGQLWKILRGKLSHNTPMCRAQWWILWRRVAGGLSAGQQQQIAEPLLGGIRALHRQITEGRGRGSDINLTTHEGAEIWRMLGSFERLTAEMKIELGEMILDLAWHKKMKPVADAMIWSVGRLGGRHMLYGPLNSVVPVNHAQKWIETIMKKGAQDEIECLALMELARNTADRYRDVEAEWRKKVIYRMENLGANDHLMTLVERPDELDREEEGLVFGESLPIGLRATERIATEE